MQITRHWDRRQLAVLTETRLQAQLPLGNLPRHRDARSAVSRGWELWRPLFRTALLDLVC